MPYDLQPLVIRAVERYADPDGQWDGLFNSATFAAVVKEEFDLPAMPDGRWVADVLRGLWYVDNAAEGVKDAHWRYGLPTRPEKVRQAEAALEAEPVEVPENLRTPPPLPMKPIEPAVALRPVSPAVNRAMLRFWRAAERFAKGDGGDDKPPGPPSPPRPRCVCGHRYDEHGGRGGSCHSEGCQCGRYTSREVS